MQAIKTAWQARPGERALPEVGCPLPSCKSKFYGTLDHSMAEPGDSPRAGRVAFTYPDFSLYQLARFCIVAGLEMQSVAVGWQIYEITKRPLDLGLVGLAQFLPGILLFLVSGHAADRFDRRKIADYLLRLGSACARRSCCYALQGLRHGLPDVRAWWF